MKREWLETMLRIRAFEARVNELFARGLVRGTTHLCIGQEAIPTGVCAALRADDLVSATHRGHGAAIAKGLDCYRLMAEILGRREGYCRGRGGSQHVACLSKGFLGTNGITGGNLPIATGAALAVQRLGQDRVVVAFLGDGAVNQGTFHESLNMAAIWKLPIIYVCENNLYAMSAPTHAFVAGGDIARRADAYGMPYATIDGNDVVEVHGCLSAVVDRARGGVGPCLVECRTYRRFGHSKSDKCEYRSDEEEREWLERDPIVAARRAFLVAQSQERFGVEGEPLPYGRGSERAFDEMQQRVEVEIAEAAERAMACPMVEDDTLFDFVTPDSAESSRMEAAACLA